VFTIYLTNKKPGKW